MSSNTGFFCFWKEKSSLINLILNAKSEKKHDSSRVYRPDFLYIRAAFGNFWSENRLESPQPPIFGPLVLEVWSHNKLLQVEVMRSYPEIGNDNLKCTL